MIFRILCCVLSLIPVCLGQINGAEAYQRFLEWKKDPQIAVLKWEDSIQKYRITLKSQGVAAALKTGGIVVVECTHKEAGNALFEYDSNELLQIFQDFRILKYEDVPGLHDWARKELRMVRLIAQKQ